MACEDKIKPDRGELPGQKNGNNLGTKPILFLRIEISNYLILLASPRGFEPLSPA